MMAMKSAELLGGLQRIELDGQQGASECRASGKEPGTHMRPAGPSSAPTISRKNLRYAMPPGDGKSVRSDLGRRR